MILRFPQLLLLLSLASLPATAAQWREVGQVPDRDTAVSVDDASMAVDHDTIVDGWVRFEYGKPQNRDGQKLNAYVSHRMVNCAINRYWLMDSYGTRSTGEQVRLYSELQEWQMPPPDSEDEIASAALCNEAKSIFGKLWDKLEIVSRLQLVWKMLQAAIAL